jgi:dinuclear metal center YbgI/SA1388 family protein
MMKVRDILAGIDSFAPFRSAKEWDNVGLMIGDPLWEINRLAVSLDPLPEVLEEALRQGCQGLLTHHPLFFKPLRFIDLSSPAGRMIDMAVKVKIAVMSAHTNWDSAEGGVNRTLAEKLELMLVAPLVRAESGAGGMGATGELPAAVSARELLGKIKRAWNLTRIDYYGDRDCSILRVALCGGSGGSLWPAALSAGADLYITADMKYHDLLDCARERLPAAVVDHGEMESAALDELARRVALTGEVEAVVLGRRVLKTPLRF